MPLLIENRANRVRQAFLIVEDCPFSLECRQTVVAPSLGPRERRMIPRRILAMKRGDYMLDRVVLRGGDPAGLFLCERRFSLPRKVLVLPGIEPLPELNIRRRRAVVAPTGTPFGAAGSSQEFYGVREYNASDGMRHIHWKSSARLGRLMVREFERHAVASVAILLDAEARYVSGRSYWSNLEYQVRAAASICRHAAGLYCQTAFATGGEREFILPPMLSAQAEWDVLRCLAALRPGPAPLAPAALRLGEHLPPDSTVFCLSLSEDEELRRALDVLAEHGMGVRWFCAAPESFRNERRLPDRRLNRSAPNRKRSPGRPEPVLLAPGLPLRRVLSDVS
ncbi:MAG: DUF58 domain-containing protein [Kiritimatiellaeota bacterium]|nr:DUF58 domain-containing protein [Kiritimatiellota bacterium]